MTVSLSGPRAKPRWLALLIMVAALLAATIVTVFAHGGTADPTPTPSGYFTVVDQQGANDVPGQVDLTQLGRDDTTDPGTYRLFWSWDSVSAWTGQGQTGDACALFDTDGDTNVNFVVCVRVENFNANPDDVRIRAVDGTHPVFAFSCSDKKNDRCTNPDPVSYTSGDVNAGALGDYPLDPTDNLITHSDPFAAGESFNHDSTVEVHILSSVIPGDEALVNVCSYPSAGNGGNNNPFDCILVPGSGLLSIVKDAGSGVTTPNFTFDVHRVVNPSPVLEAQRTVAGSGTATPVALLVGNNIRVTETNINSTWELTAVACKLEDGTTSTGTVDLANNRVSGVEIRSGEITTCTFTDRLRTGTLVVIKHVVNDNGGTAAADDFSYTLGDGSSATNETGAESPGTSYTRDHGTSYNVQENSGGPDGYSVSYSDDCSGSVVAGQTKTCTITNDDDAPSLTLNKTVVNDNGGTAAASAWTLSASGPTGFSGAGPAVSNGASFDAGSYDLSESGPSGYTASAWVCTGGSQSDDDTVVVGLGDAVSCTITNDDDGPALFLAKNVVNDNGGTASASSWTLYADSLSVAGSASGALVTDQAGSYDLSESSVPGYTNTSITCDDDPDTEVASVTLDLGETITCTFVNDDDAPSLTLNKVVTNDNGGTAAASAWTLSASGPTGFSGAGPAVSNGASFDAGSYDLSESGPSGYTASAWVCTGGSQSDDDTVVVGLGDAVSCTITNDDDKAQPSGTTVQHWVLHDTLTITGLRPGAPVDAENPAATVDFVLYSDDQCSVEVGSELDRPIASGVAATSDGVTVYETGFYYWTAFYSGDQYNEPFDTNCDEVTQIQAKDDKDGGRDDLIELVADFLLSLL